MIVSCHNTISAQFKQQKKLSSLVCFVKKYQRIKKTQLLFIRLGFVFFFLFVLHEKETLVSNLLHLADKRSVSR